MAALGESTPYGLYKLLGSLGAKVYWRMEGLRSNSPDELYLFLISHDKRPDDLVVGGKEFATAYSAGSSDIDVMRHMARTDTMTYLPDDILTKVDRASMSAGLEARVPLLDHRMVEFAATLPTHMKIRHGQGKYLLRKLLEKYIPASLFDRPNKGFGIPLEQWLRTDLRDWCEAMLDTRRIRNEGYLNPNKVRTMWTEFLGGRPHWQYQLWDVLMFQAWLAESK